jgi:putative intracellular protease/amidase
LSHSKKTIYLHITKTMADWEPAHVIAELRSGRYLKDPSLRFNLVLCGRDMNPVTTMGGLHLYPDLPVTGIRPGADDLFLLPGADTWLDPGQSATVKKAGGTLERGEAVVAAICGATLAMANAG